MKRIITCLLFLPACLLLRAQTPSEIAQFSQVWHLSTARVTGMGGAAGILPSELGAVNINPAALGTFQSGMLTLSPIMNMRDIQADYLGKSTDKSRRTFSIAGAGVAYSFEHAGSPFSRFNLSFGYNLNNLFSAYNDIASEENGYNRITTNGSASDYMLSFGTAYLDKLYIGVSAGINNLSCERNLWLVDHTPDRTVSGSHGTSGTGYNFKAGLMYAPTENIRVGVALHSPVFYSLTVEDYTEPDGIENPEVLTEFRYRLQTPWRFTLSAGYLLTTRATLSFDYDIVTNNLTSVSGDYSEMPVAAAEQLHRLRDTTISNEFKMAMNVRLGGEVRFGNAFVRAGAAYYGAPTGLSESIISASCGLGYRFGDATIDAAYRYSGYSETFSLYEDTSSEPVKNTVTGHLVAFTLSYRF